MASPGAQVKDITGQTFGRLEVLSYVGKDRHSNALWLCRCGGPTCDGREITVAGTDLRRGNTRSCGCLSRESTAARNSIHGLHGHPLYQVWQGMIARCHNSNHKAFARYGGRGIAVCNQWRESFETFHQDVIEGYRSGLQLDRVDNNRGYEPGNTRWATPAQNSRNTRRNNVVEFAGHSRCVTEWAELLGLSRDALRNRLRRDWPIERALTEGVAPDRLAQALGDPR
ncbi:hypothetical protein ADK55_18630 [Streptomyces sp. WM4235]|uniref:hypothetical protein n=1 Tax=Streptomyces sp. WM4235 TaxID=1415551 RepID=UPI0006C3D08F|nr:hypothetical protein [Streptomyces sp. WM4235]KOU50559.1 hypothetical protein ADK55_18630 [Streptomyces sp. WM4235]